jgi:hypothetical protein
VLLAAAGRVTERITLGPLLANPVNRHPTVTAGSIATLDELAPGRVLLGWGVGDTAVRLARLRPARVKELEAATRLMRAMLDGEGVEVGAKRPARLPHARPVPIWIAAGGPRTLRMAGGVADAVLMRVGTHPANIARAVDAIRAGAKEAGRDPDSVRGWVCVRSVRSSRSWSVVGVSTTKGYRSPAPARGRGRLRRDDGARYTTGTRPGGAYARAPRSGVATDAGSRGRAVDHPGDVHGARACPRRGTDTVSRLARRGGIRRRGVTPSWPGGHEYRTGARRRSPARRGTSARAEPRSRG